MDSLNNEDICKGFMLSPTKMWVFRYIEEIVLIKFARKANDDWHNISDTDIKELFEVEVDESELLEALGVMEMFVAFNRFADVMGIEIDF